MKYSEEEKTFKDYGREDVRDIAEDEKDDSVPLVESGKDIDQAVSIIATNLGLIEKEAQVAIVKCCVPCIPEIIIKRKDLRHIAQKRENARERYVKVALHAMENPYEIWERIFNENEKRLVFIGINRENQQVAVTVSIKEGNVLWNFMHCDKKRINRHRKGTLIYGK